MTTKNELLAKAKSYNITGRHEMTKVELEAAVGEHEMRLAAEAPSFSKDAVKNVVRRYPSLAPRGNDGKVIRTGRNLSGNLPFKHKFYYLNPAVANRETWTAAYAEAYTSAPKQVQGLIDFMAARSITSASRSLIGKDIAENAKNLGFVTSKIAGDQLFAYYRRALETLGVIHAKGLKAADLEDLEDEDSSDEE